VSGGGFARTKATAAGVSAAVSVTTEPIESALFPVFKTAKDSGFGIPGVSEIGVPSSTASVEESPSNRFTNNRAPPKLTTNSGCISVAVASPPLPDEFTVKIFAPVATDAGALIVM